jgi:ribosomal protein S18 acetylase RimI-like enzyme
MSEYENSTQELSNNLVVREPTSLDHDVALKIYNGAYHDVEVEQFGPWDQELQYKLFMEAWDNPEFKMINFYNKSCGYIIVENKPEGSFINEVVIDVKFQGRGMGGFLIKQIQGAVAKDGLIVSLEVLKKNHKAKKLYEKLGFKDVGETKTHYQMEWISETE